MKRISRFVSRQTALAVSFLLMILTLMLPNSSQNALAVTFSKKEIAVEAVTRVIMYSPLQNRLKKLPYVYANETLENNTFIPSVQNGDLLIISSYALGDIIDYTSPEYEDGIKTSFISLSKCFPCSKEKESIYQRFELPYSSFNIIPIEDLENGLYKITIEIITSANEYSNLFFKASEQNSLISYFFSVGEERSIEHHSAEYIPYKLFNLNADGSENIFERIYEKNISTGISTFNLKTFHVTHDALLSFYDEKETIPDNVVAFVFFFSGKSEMYKTERLDEIITLSDFIEPNSNATLNFAYLYDDGCLSDFSYIYIITTDLENTSLDKFSL